MLFLFLLLLLSWENHIFAMPSFIMICYWPLLAPVGIGLLLDCYWPLKIEQRSNLDTEPQQMEQRSNLDAESKTEQRS